MPPLVLYITAAILFLRASPLPYGNYALLGFVATPVFAWAAVEAYRIDRIVLACIYVLLAVVFNPFVPVELDRDTWFVVEVGVGIFIVLTARLFYGSPMGEGDDR